MNSLKKRMIGHINAVREHFIVNENNFSVVEGTCRYNGPNGEHCAFAVVVPEDLRVLLLEFNDCTDLIKAHDVLKEAVCKTEDGRYVKLDFFWKLQGCHDDAAARNNCTLQQGREILIKNLCLLEERVMKGEFG